MLCKHSSNTKWHSWAGLVKFCTCCCPTQFLLSILPSSHYPLPFSLARSSTASTFTIQISQSKWQNSTTETCNSCSIASSAIQNLWRLTSTKLPLKLAWPSEEIGEHFHKHHALWPVFDSDCQLTVAHPLNFVAMLATVDLQSKEWNHVTLVSPWMCTC